MEKLSFFGALALLILVSSPLVFSYSCEGVSSENYQTCLEIANSDLNSTDKQMLISNLDYYNKFEPNHFFVYSKNLDLEILNAPEGVKNYSGNYFKNAWMKIFTLMPSINYSNNLYVPINTKILTGFNYEFVQPIDYKSSGYPKKQDGDCRTTYRLLEKTETNKVYVNGIYQGQGQLVPIIVNQDSKVESIYNIKISYDVNHYGWDKYCCKRVDGICKKYCYDCDYDHDETKTGQITIKDLVDVKIYKNNLFAKIEEFSQLPYSNKLKLNYSDSVIVSFTNSEYDYYRYLFEIIYSLPPYNVVILKAVDYGAESLKNLFKQEDSLVVNNLDNCKIVGFDFFNEVESACSVENSYVGLKIETDKLTYDIGEDVEINIFPSNILVNISYANKTYTAKNKINLKAEKLYNRITAVYGSELADKVIYVKDNSKLDLLYNLFWVILIFVLLYILIKKYWRLK